MGSGRYVNYLGDDEPGDPVAAYGPNHRRLQQVKALLPRKVKNQEVRERRLHCGQRSLRVACFPHGIAHMA